MALVLVTWVILAGSVASAAVIVIPNRWRVEATRLVLPPSTSGSGSALAAVSASVRRVGISILSEHVITHIAFRPDSKFASAFRSTISNFQINLSTTSAAPDALSVTLPITWVSMTVVFSGSLVSSAFTASGRAKGF